MASRSVSDVGPPWPWGIHAAMVALLLMGVAGFVDATGYLALWHIYTANMSGNSIDVGRAISEGNWSEALMRLTPILSFVGGAFLVGALVEVMRQRGMRRRVVLALSVEVASLIGFVIAAQPLLAPRATLPHPPGGTGIALVVLAAIAMGAQNATLRDAGVLDIYTTHITGLLTRLAREAVVYVCSLLGRGDCDPPLKLLQLGLLAVLWVIYVGGAVGGAAAWRLVGLRLMWIPIGIIACIGLFDLMHPLAPPKKHQQHN